MSQYKCPARGDCDVADAGSVLDVAAGADPVCEKCGAMLSLVPGDTSGAQRGGKKLPLMAAGVAALVLAVGGGALLMNKPAPDPIAAAAAPPAASAAPLVAAASASGGMAPSDAEIREQRLEGDAKLVRGDLGAAEVASNKAAAAEMLKVAIGKLGQGRLDDAEKDLLDARNRDPKQSLVYYNMAVLRLKQGRTSDAIKELEASFMAGFSYFEKMDGDSDIDALRKEPAFAKLVAIYRPAVK